MEYQDPAFEALYKIVAMKSSPILAWIGAGLSVPARNETGDEKEKTPTWNELRAYLTGALNRKAETFTEVNQKDYYRRLVTRIRAIPNNWIAFDELKKSLGYASYRQTIESLLAPTASMRPPTNYDHLWRMGIKGVLNLNLDSFAKRSYPQTRKDGLESFLGRDAGKNLTIVRKGTPFVANLHGVIQNYDSWVFTYPELNDLMNNPSYRKFIELCVSMYTLLFVGLTPDDFASGGHLESLTKLGLDIGTHFWITDRSDPQLDKWAEGIGIRTIRYNPKNEHEELAEMLRTLATSRVEDEEVPEPAFISASPAQISVLPTPDELLEYTDTNEIRKVLNAEAARILADRSELAYENYFKFSRLYDEPIHRTWYLPAEPKGYKVLAYTLDSYVARGGFGKVYRAIDASGNQVALKILNDEIRKQPTLLQSFRRGVNSMRILARNKVEGMVAYKEASEIPAFVVMDWIDGPNLYEAVQAKQLEGWELKIRTAKELADIIRRAHALPVLHRDIRPENIMLQNFYYGDEWNVVVLDFDLSWHIGAIEKSITEGSLSGYLAPEQVVPISNMSTRHASVDSFGVGMTLYFLLTGQPPRQNQHITADWQRNLFFDASLRPCPLWKSLPMRFARLILNATREKQYERWDMTQINQELGLLVEAIRKPLEVDSAELLAEELVSRTEWMASYEWDFEKRSTKKSFTSGFNVEVFGDEVESSVELKIDWEFQGQGSWQNIYNDSKQRLSSIVDMLTKGKWSVDRDITDRTFHIVASVDKKECAKDLEKHSNLLDRIFDLLSKIRH